MKRAYECTKALLTALRMARQHGGVNAKMHVGDVIALIEAFQTGEIDDSAPVAEGPFYPQRIQ